MKSLCYKLNLTGNIKFSHAVVEKKSMRLNSNPIIQNFFFSKNLRLQSPRMLGTWRHNAEKVNLGGEEQKETHAPS
jgi:hypothetical protein